MIKKIRKNLTQTKKQNSNTIQILIFKGIRQNPVLSGQALGGLSGDMLTGDLRGTLKNKSTANELLKSRLSVMIKRGFSLLKGSLK